MSDPQDKIKRLDELRQQVSQLEAELEALKKSLT